MFSLVKTSMGQVDIENTGVNNDPTHLINNILLGSGVVALNIQFYGDTTNQLGFFRGNGSTKLPMDSGIVLSTGNVQSIENITGQASSPIPATANSGGLGPAYFGNGSGDNLLNVSASLPGLLGQNFPTPSQVRDACVLEFDFVPSSDTVEFRYIFASEEWNNFPCQTFNDVFGFFVSGPGINGSFNSPAGFPDSAINVAYVPGTNPQIPITISSVHPGGNNCGVNSFNSQFYVPNGSDSGSTTTPSIELAFNGLTTIMTAKFAVTPCDTYHIALSIADGQDQSLDSGVFLEAKSFGTPNFDVDAKPSFNTFGNDSNLYEGCGEVELQFRRFANFQDTATAYYTISGTAINGTDYTSIADSTSFFPGDETSSINFNIMDDGIAEGVETLIITIFPDTGLCIPGDTTVVTLYINDRPPFDVDAIKDSVHCSSPTLTLSTDTLSGIPNYWYRWSTGDTIASPTVTISSDTMFFVTATDACGIDTIIDTAIVKYGLLNTTVDVPNITIFCQETDTLRVNTSNENGILQYTWEGSTSNTDTLVVNPIENTWYTVTVTDVCNGNIVDSGLVTVKSDTFLIADSSFTYYCYLDSLLVGPKIISSNSVKYQWNSTGDTTKNIYIKTNADFTYLVTVSDICYPGQPLVAQINIDYTEGNPVEVIDLVDTIAACKGDNVTMYTSASGGFGPYRYRWTNAFIADSSYTFPVNNDTTIQVVGRDRCGNTASRTGRVRLQTYDQMVATKSSDTIYCIGRDLRLFATGTGGRAPLTFEWSSKNDSYSPINDTSILANINDTVNIYTFKMTDGCNTSLENYIYVSGIYCLVNGPNIMTPNGDGVNDYLVLIKYEEHPNTKVRIYTRWGHLVYTSDDYKNDFDGEGLSDGTYFYTVETFLGQKTTGNVTLMRQP